MGEATTTAGGGAAPSVSVGSEEEGDDGYDGGEGDDGGDEGKDSVGPMGDGSLSNMVEHMSKGGEYLSNAELHVRVRRASTLPTEKATDLSFLNQYALDKVEDESHSIAFEGGIEGPVARERRISVAPIPPGSSERAAEGGRRSSTCRRASLSAASAILPSGLKKALGVETDADGGALRPGKSDQVAPFCSKPAGSEETVVDIP